ncbi:hypothetical protein FQN54_008687 [Arachnomyces sp. PD_36]|nr:hypothetical protein FQN54_008687 [Arachnomyces sp. PD_36]
MLTPIRVRGKKTKHDASSNGPPERESPSRLWSNSAPTPSARVKETPSQHLEMTDPRTSQKTLSRLETLPVELIENIFLSCLDINLPRSSPYIAAALTSERIYRLLILLSFFDGIQVPDSGQPPAPEILKIFRPLDYRVMPTDERKRLQIAVLDCRWCTLDRIQKQVPTLIHLTVYHHWLKRGITMEEGDKAELDKVIREAEPGQKSFHDFWGKHHGEAYKLMLDPPFWVSFTDHMGLVEPPDDLYLSYQTVDVLHFPDKILRGSPWNDEKVAFLEFLSRAYRKDSPRDVFVEEAKRDKNISFSLSAAQEGIHEAIVTQNPRALRRMLLLNGIFARNHNYLLPQGGSYRLDPEHFRNAVRHPGGDSTLLKVLVYTMPGSTPCDDPEITEWATEARDRGDPFGEWLLDLMLELPGVLNLSGPPEDLVHRTTHDLFPGHSRRRDIAVRERSAFGEAFTVWVTGLGGIGY